MRTYFPNFDLEVNFMSDIEAQIDLCDNGKLCVDYDKIQLDSKDNYLEYEDSVIVNISALYLLISSIFSLFTNTSRAK